MKKSLSALALAAWLPLFLALSPGNPAPDFSAKNQDGKVVRLSDFAGKPVLVYFYPKDETPGCTQEACSLRDEFTKFRKLGAVVLGVSTQGEASHREFKTQHKLPFDLLVDQDGKVARAMGVESIEGAGIHKRESVLLGSDHKVIRVYRDVDPSRHAAEVLRDLEQAQSGF